MKSISDFKNEEAIDLLADLVDPIHNIIQDQDIKIKIANKSTQKDAIKLVLKNHKESLLSIVALFEGVSREDLACTPISIVVDCMQILNDKDFLDFLSSLAENME